MHPVQLVVVFAMIVYAVYKQTRVAPAAGPGRFKMAVIYAVVGISSLAASGWQSPDGAGWLFLVGGIVLSVLVGVARGYLTRVWVDAEGRSWRQGTALTISLFVVVVVVKVGLGVIAVGAGVHDGSSFGEVLLVVAVMIAAQIEIVHRRVLALAGSEHTHPAHA